ncbi:MAG: class I SAM-dependent methyltransferase [Gammaproteobacteria bacterium]|nr:class I SAM-dependent methyltransferase [Gammaproteobacteria bacterium]
MSRKKVYEQYEKIVDWFDTHRNKDLFEKPYFDFIVNTVPPGGEILDLGCGTGEPIAKFFIEKGFKITGVDGSHKMIELCKKRFPSQTWLIEDMQEINLAKQFDAILAWHSFFHLDHDAQRNMFKLFNRHLKSKGVLAFTSGPEHDECWSDNGGEELFHASLSPQEYEALLKQNTFEVLIHKVRDPECGSATIWVAQKI